MNDSLASLIQFLQQSPTSWHAVHNAGHLLQEAGFIELDEAAAWTIKKGGCYFVKRNGTSLCAFIVPHQLPTTLRMIASHTDSPALKVKPNAEFLKENMVMLGVEAYGGPLLTSWLNRDLGIAGHVAYRDAKGYLRTTLINLTDSPVVLPQLAIHLDREVNEKGLTLNKQTHLAVLAALIPEKKESKKKKEKKPEQEKYLEGQLQEKIGKGSTLLAADLYLYPLESPQLVGANQQLLAGYRLDNLASLYASLQALLRDPRTSESQLNMIICWDHEEIGSNTAQGAESPFFKDVVERILLKLEVGREEQLRLYRNSLCVSVDLAHALHPNYAEKHEPLHSPLLGEGIVIKFSTQQRYATDAVSASTLIDLCQRHHLPYQKFTNRGDIPGGSTIGPIHASKTGIPTVDIGCPMLSMHSARELMSCKDHQDMCSLLQVFFTER